MLVKKQRVLFFIVIILLLRFACIWLMGLMPQDAYYHFYGEHPALSYFDHPPIIAYTLRLSTEIFGKKAFALKLADTIVTLLTILFFYRLALLFLSKHKAQRAVLLLFSTLMITILSLVSTPDVPLLLFWSLSLITLYKAIFLDKKIYWMLSGICMGLAFDSKYTAIFLIFGLVLFLLLSAKYRSFIFSRWFLLCMLIFLITILPVIIWNAQNNFASFRFQSQGRITSSHGIHIDISNFGGVIGHQSAILMPVLFFALIYFLLKFLKKYRLRFILSILRNYSYCVFLCRFLQGFSSFHLFIG